MPPRPPGRHKRHQRLEEQEFATNNDVGFGQRQGSIATRKMDAVADVAAECAFFVAANVGTMRCGGFIVAARQAVRPDQWCIRRHGCFGIHNSVQRFVVHKHQVGGILSSGFITCHNERHRLAGKYHALTCQHEPVAR